jgi:uncharacterized protein YndB with AHSA1/START domain
MTEDTLTFERLIKAPRERVWQAWTDPEEVKKWWGPKYFTAPVVEIDLREGGRYKYCMRGAVTPGGEEQDFWSAGEFQEIVPHERIVVSDWFSNENGDKVPATEHGLSADFPTEMQMTVTFNDEGDGLTRVKVIYSLPDSPEVREAMLKSGMEEGWNTTLEKLATSVEEIKEEV